MGKKFNPNKATKFVMSVPVEDARKYYYGTLYDEACLYARNDSVMLLVGGAGCTVGRMWLDGLGGAFDVVEPDVNRHEEGKKLYAGQCRYRYRDISQVDLWNPDYAVVVWDAWHGLAPVEIPAEFVERCRAAGLPLVAYGKDGVLCVFGGRVNVR